MSEILHTGRYVFIIIIKKNVQQLCDGVISTCTKISEDCFQHIVEFIPQRIKEAMKPNGLLTQY